MTPGLDKTPHPIMGYVTPGLDKKVRLLALQHNKVVKTYECDDPVYSVEFVKASLVISTETEVLSSLSRRVCINFESISGTRGGVQLHFCTWPPDFCQMYMYKMYKNVQKCTK